MSSAPIAFQGELQLLGWAESDRGGRTVKFQCSGDDAEHPFKRFGAKARFAVVLVQIGDDEQPVPQPAVPTAIGGVHLSNTAALLCKDKDFWVWIEHRVWGVPVSSEQKAAEVLKEVLEIDSRSLLDSDPEAAARFITEIANPYNEWRKRAMRV